ncbi:zf-HC2 domain-containing protein [Streptomyces sp. NPDC046821]|uniref:anti-sigma factor family protein n=1 Tax=Streptomyces sp. NPDC046821 TaxID=3154702 RepID=UPI0033DB7378
MTSSYDDYGPYDSGEVHETVGAYVLGILDEAEATAFEAHLAGCDLCARQLEEFAGMEPMLAALAGLPEPQGTPARERVGAQLGARPSEQLAERLFAEVAQKQAHKRRRGMVLVACAASLIIGGPLAVLAASGGGTNVAEPPPHPTVSSAESWFQHADKKVTATDPGTHVTATIGMQSKPWGTDTVLELKNVKGPQSCSLIAVGKNGERETVTSWTVPKWGYGIPNSNHYAAKYPLYVQGGAAFQRNAIDHFEVRTLDGKQLVEVDA